MATNKNKECKIVSQLVKDPKAPPETRILAGYLGRSALEAHCRLYRDATLNDWVEIPEDAILHMEDWPPASHTWGGKHVWVQRDAQLVPAPQPTRAADTHLVLARPTVRVRSTGGARAATR